MATGSSNESAVCSFPSLDVEMRDLVVHEISPGHNHYHPNAKNPSFLQESDIHQKNL